MSGVTYHVLGAGLADIPANHIFRARLNAVLTVTNGQDTAIVYGCKQPHQPQSEAASGVAYLKAHARRGNPQPVADDSPKSTSETMAIIATHIHASVLAGTQVTTPLGPAPLIKPHMVVTNWYHAPRTRYLLRKQWQRMYPQTEWSKATAYFSFWWWVGGTFWPSWKVRGLKTIVWWPLNVVVRESLATIKARLDPYDKKFNQKRRW